MSTPHASDHPAQSRAKPGQSSERRPVVLVLQTPPSPAVLAPDATTGRIVHDDAVATLLERVIQRIFRAGLLLHPARTEISCELPNAEPALDELDSALNDIRATVLSWTPRSRHVGLYQQTDDLHTVIAHLGVANEILSRLAAVDAAGGDGTRWIAINDAGHTVHRAVVELLEISERCRSE